MLKPQQEKRVCIAKELIIISLISVIIILSIFFVKLHGIPILFIVLTWLIVSGIYLGLKYKRKLSIEKFIELNASYLEGSVVQCVCFSAFKQRQDANETYKPHIQYKFEYKGEVIESSQYGISFDDIDCNFNFDKKTAEKKVEEYKNMNQFTIFYNPQTSQSVLSLEFSKGYGIPYVGYVIVNALFLYIAYKVHLAFGV